MKNNFKIFIATNELMKSPFVAPLSASSDAALILGKTTTLTFSLPLTHSAEAVDVSYNPAMLELEKVEVQTLPTRQSKIITITALGRELGNTFLTVHIKPLRGLLATQLKTKVNVQRLASA